MSQSDWAVMDAATETGVTLVTDLNSGRDAWLSNHSGTVKPTYMTDTVYVGALWLDTNASNAWELNLWDGDTSVKLFTVDSVAHTAAISVDSIGITGAMTMGGNLSLTTNSAIIDLVGSAGNGTIHVDTLGYLVLEGVSGLYFGVNSSTKLQMNGTEFKPLSALAMSLGSTNLRWNELYIDRILLGDFSTGATHNVATLQIDDATGGGISLGVGAGLTKSIYWAVGANLSAAMIQYQNATPRLDFSVLDVNGEIRFRTGNPLVEAMAIESNSNISMYGDLTLSAGELSVSGSIYSPVGVSLIDEEGKIFLGQWGAESTEVWIGADSTYSYGNCSGTMVFQAPTQSNYGWIWRKLAHAVNDASMSLNTDGFLRIASGIHLDEGRGIADFSNFLFLEFASGTGSPQNHLKITNNPTGTSPVIGIATTGTDTNIDITLTPLGTGSVVVSNGLNVIGAVSIGTTNSVAGALFVYGPSSGWEGGQIDIEGAGAYANHTIDSYYDKLRIFQNSASDTEVQLQNAGAGAFNLDVLGSVGVSAGINLTGKLNIASGNSYDKIQLWGAANYSIGMYSARLYGALTSYATTFTMVGTGEGWLFRDNGHSDSQGAMSLTTSGEMTVLGASVFESTLEVEGDLTVGLNSLKFTNSQDPFKIQLWSNSDRYSIGMAANYTYGQLATYAMIFTMDTTTDMGWLWRTNGHTNAQGSMSLTTQGELTVLGASLFESTLTVTGLFTPNGDISLGASKYIYASASNDVTKFRLWGNNGSYGLGMASGYTFGDSTTHNMIFNMSSGSQGFLWRNAGQSTGTAAMYLSSGGLLNLKGQIRHVNFESLSGTTGAVNWDLDADPKVKMTPTGNLTITPTNIKNNSSGTITIIQGGTGRTISWASTVKWAGGTAPDLNVANKTYVISVYSYDGTNVVGASLEEIS